MFKIKFFTLICLLSCMLALACSPMPSAPPPAPIPISATPSSGSQPSPFISIQYLGHSCFLITSTTGTRIITDPYTPTSRFTYGEINESADIVTVTHEHADHNNLAAVKGNPSVVRGVGTQYIKGIEFKGISAWHDDVKGAQRGADTVICFNVDGVKFCHAGDLGHRLNAEQLAEIGQVDVLFVPVGGFFTIDAATATEVCNDLKPRIVIPMHYKTPQFNVGLSPVDDFLQGKENVKRIEDSIFEFKPGELPPATQVIVLQPAR
ncbi:MAG: MBL fold metallo-hydrolase [Dehalococcoidia bacterium]|nr:MBL fold metallo-hydrolase [Dehalococcoidia bacterium]MDD5495185.1 MBL fold metallo-hydrolase [Dehalococcoidia bacterium]